MDQVVFYINNLIGMTTKVEQSINLNLVDMVVLFLCFLDTSISPLLIRQELAKMLGDTFEGIASFGLGMKEDLFISGPYCQTSYFCFIEII
jgi:hypothetical protein